MKNKSQVLLIDDDPDVLQAYQALLALESDEKGYEIIALNNPLDAESIITEDWQGVVVSDIYMPQLSGWQLLERLHEKDKNLPVILITGHGDVPMAIDAMQKGAFYFIEKPVDPERLLQQIDLALTQRQAQLALKHWQQQELETHLIGQSKWIKNLRRRLQQLSQTDLPIFIFGEIGTGKTLTAHYLHELAKTRFPQKQSLELLGECDTEELQSQLNAAQNTTFIIGAKITGSVYFTQPQCQNYCRQPIFPATIVGASQIIARIVLFVFSDPNRMPAVISSHVGH